MTRRSFERAIDVCSAFMAASFMVVSLICGAGYSSRPASAQTEPKQPPKDYLQRSLQIYEFRKAAPDGVERGQEIFYYKCWFCHNEYVKDIPQLKGLFQKTNLISGLPVNETNVKDRLRNGGPNMPAYKYVLDEADLEDLVTYLKEKCCWDSDSPPPNPRYRAR